MSEGALDEAHLVARCSYWRLGEFLEFLLGFVEPRQQPLQHLRVNLGRLGVALPMLEIERLR